LLISFIIIQPINAIAEENLKSNVQLSNTNLTPIMGKSQATKEQMVEYLSRNNPNKTKEYINSFVTWTIEESNIENVRADVAFALMMKETGFLKFGGSVSETQNNFGGLGAIDGETAGACFGSIQMGIRAVVQHLKAYASQDPLNQDCIDPRYNLVSPKGKAPNVEDLGGRWAVPGYDVNKYRDFETALLNNDTYGQHIVNMVNRIKDIPTNILPPPETPAKIKEVKGNDIGYKGVDYRMTTNATSVSGVEYKYWLNDKSTNEWKLLKDYSEINSYTWKPEKAGKYRLVVHVRSKSSTKKYDDYGYKDIEVKVLPPAKIKEVKGNNIGYKGIDYTITANATSTNGVEYKYWLNDKSTNEWKLLKDYSEINSYTWKPEKAGKYRLVVHVKDKNSTKEYDDYAYLDIDVRDNIVYNKKVMLDPGHGGKDPGAQGNGLNEKDIVLSIALKTGEILKKHNIDVKYSRTTDVFVELADRASMANNANSDVFVSFHCNSFTDGSAKGTETYHYPGSTEGAKLAKAIQDSIIKNGVYNRDRGVKEEDFAVLRLTKMPAALVETAFIKNSQDANILKNRQDEMAKAIAMGILDYLEIPYNETSGELYRVQAGAFGQRENAQNLVDKLKSKGYEAIIVELDSSYKVQIGAFSQRENAEKLVEQLKSDGFEAIVVR
ncbi:MAG: N-acetylmuramoyl-L-alanine amidase, partial [Clostridiaceae bacterium]|nr:N-acetylmuramoyl-L-alanine amidase [Clostridiaceae bacterium]